MLLPYTPDGSDTFWPEVFFGFGGGGGAALLFRFVVVFLLEVAFFAIDNKPESCSKC